VPIAVSWTVAPGPNVTVVGEITIESIEVLLPQPIKGTARLTKSNALKQKRPDIELSSRFGGLRRTGAPFSHSFFPVGCSKFIAMLN
jgi:hypothetical protein